eukprot:5813639-Lingulodinium_polyedra.AAC.1
MLASALREFAYLKIERRLGNMEPDDLERAKHSLSTKLLAAMTESLGSIEYVRDAFCVVHQKKCPVTPRASPEPDVADAIWVEAAGSVCVPWSAMGSRSHWLHPTTLPALVWLFST